MDEMKKCGGICFWPTPIMHSTKPPYDGSRNSNDEFCHVSMQFIKTFVTSITTFAIDELHQDMANVVIEVAKVGLNSFKLDG
jgi:hypothetical protein